MPIFYGLWAIGFRAYTGSRQARLRRIRQGRRPELTGGGLIRSLGGWAASKKLRLKGQDRLKGDSDFVTSVLAEANEKLERFHEIKSRGYTIEKVKQRVREIFGVEKDMTYSKGRRRIQVPAGIMLCYWAMRPPNWQNGLR